jgi:hypothetical protein
MSGVQVVARTAAVGLSAEAARTSSIRAGAGAILGGTVRTDGDRVRVALVLTRAESTDPLLQGDYERDVKDVFALQLQIASDVARALGVAVTPTAAAERDAARQVDPAAYEDYLRGRVAAVNGNDDAAAESYARALTVDDGLAEAHAAYAEALYRRAPADPVAADAERSLIKRAAARAVELAPDLPAANLAAGAAAESVADALTALHSAVRTDPSFAEAYRAIAAEIADLDPERSRRFQQKAAMLDPALDANRQIPTPSPDACEVLMERMAAATSSRRSASADRQQALAAMARADSRDAGPHVLRCAALAAAALGRAGAAGALLQRIASTDAAFRLWTTSAGTRSTYRIEAQTFPWSRVYGQPPFIEAKSALDQADRRARERIADILQDLQF